VVLALPGERAACHRPALELYHGLGRRRGQGLALLYLGAVQRRAGDYPAAAASSRQALSLFRDLRDLRSQAYSLNELGPGAAADRGLPGVR
jgi:hypothetical protein